MRGLKYVALASAVSIVGMTSLAHSQQASEDVRSKSSCRGLLQEMQQELRQLDLGQKLNSRVEELVQEARNASNDEQCVRSLRQANAVVNREIGERPLRDERFRQALQKARSDQRGSQHEAYRGTSNWSDSDAARIPVTYTSELVGRYVYDNRGNEAGELEYMVIDTHTSDIRFAVISSGGLFDIGDELIAVPWQHLQVRTWGATSEPRLQLAFGADKLRQSQRLTHDNLDQLAQPTYQTDLITYFLPVRPTDAQSTGRRAAGGDQGRRPSDMRRPSDAQSDQVKGSGEEDKDQQTARAKDPQRRQATGQDGRGGDQLMLVGRELITRLVMSPMRTSTQVRGATVKTSDGREAGEIDRLVVDVERGKVAYALVAKGGFLGIGEEWRAVPLAALQWAGQDTYKLNQSQGNLESMPKLTRDELPSRIRQGDLKKLYQAYSVDPYWQVQSRTDREDPDRRDTQR